MVRRGVKHLLAALLSFSPDGDQRKARGGGQVVGDGRRRRAWRGSGGSLRWRLWRTLGDDVVESGGGVDSLYVLMVMVMVWRGRYDDILGDV